MARLYAKPSLEGEPGRWDVYLRGRLLGCIYPEANSVRAETVSGHTKLLKDRFTALAYIKQKEATE